MTATTTEATTATAAPADGQDRAFSCFVIGPIGDDLAVPGTAAATAYESALEVFEKVIRPACARFGIAPVRADELAGAGEITEQICRHVLMADIVIADVGGGNANVMYELGLRHAIGKPAIHIGENGQLPFDISPIRTIRFTRSRNGLIEARRNLEKALHDGIHNGFDLLTPARILQGKQIPPEAADEGTEDEPADEDAPGLIDRFVAIEEQMDALTGDADAMAEALARIAAATQESTPEMERANQPGFPLSARMPLLMKYASAISEPAADLKDSAKRFAERMSEVDTAVNAALDFHQAIPPGERSDSDDEFISGLIGTAEGTRQAMEGVKAFGTAIKSMIGMSRELRGPAKDIAAALKEVGTVIARIDAWERRARTLS
ncbi:hypothetical protein [Streptomyces goshikiensis]|uniref:hypothetical protein n=1 Tax=Streptomyces goshikiensis TaxID=1942 RepID=UPI0036A86AA1